MTFGNEFWLILFWEYISPKLFAVHSPVAKSIVPDLRDKVHSGIGLSAGTMNLATDLAFW
jgi:hypothetical protein